MVSHERRKQASRERILDAALELFRSQGMDGTTIDEICARADVAPRTFFNHFPKRDDMVRALAALRLEGLQAVLAKRADKDQPVPALLTGLFDDVAKFLQASGPFYRELVGTMLALAYATPPASPQRAGELHGWFLALIKEGAGKGEVTDRHEPSTLTDIVMGTLVAVLMNWTADAGYGIRSGLHEAGVALADLLAPG
jgi:AcrR family transcriptional regulator